MLLKVQIFEDRQKVLEIQVENPAIDLAFNQMPNTRSFYVKSEAFQVIALETEDFEPERYEIPFIIPIFEKNVNKKKIFEEKNIIVNNKVIFLYFF